jgi:hypothetical protein
MFLENNRVSAQDFLEKRYQKTNTKEGYLPVPPKGGQNFDGSQEIAEQKGGNHGDSGQRGAKADQPLNYKPHDSQGDTSYGFHRDRHNRVTEGSFGKDLVKNTRSTSPLRIPHRATTGNLLTVNPLTIDHSGSPRRVYNISNSPRRVYDETSYSPNRAQHLQQLQSRIVDHNSGDHDRTSDLVTKTVGPLTIKGGRNPTAKESSGNLNPRTTHRNLASHAMLDMPGGEDFHDDNISLSEDVEPSIIPNNLCRTETDHHLKNPLRASMEPTTLLTNKISVISLTGNAGNTKAQRHLTKATTQVPYLTSNYIMDRASNFSSTVKYNENTERSRNLVNSSMNRDNKLISMNKFSVYKENPSYTTPNRNFTGNKKTKNPLFMNIDLGDGEKYSKKKGPRIVDNKQSALDETVKYLGSRNQHTGSCISIGGGQIQIQKQAKDIKAHRSSGSEIPRQINQQYLEPTQRHSASKITTKNVGDNHQHMQDTPSNKSPVPVSPIKDYRM